MSDSQPLSHILIVGGGTAGWMAAAALSRLTQSGVGITLVESEEIGAIGVGEATIPPIRTFNAMIGVDERDFVRATGATYKLGIEFVDWARRGDRYLHPFGTFGADMDGVNFHQYWLRLKAHGLGGSIEDYNLCAQAARLGRFQLPERDPRSILSTLNYAYHFDAAAYAAFLRGNAEARGVSRVEGMVKNVERRGEDGFVAAVTLSDGRRLAADLFVDCSGFRGLLIRQALGVGYDDWSEYLPCDRAVALPVGGNAQPLPYTRATALDAGWHWRIPLQHRLGTGYVYSSHHLSDDEATDTAVSRAEGEALGEPRLIRFTAGRLRKAWSHNVVALGLASGFLEPLESTSIHLVQAGISKLLAMLPDGRFTPVLEDEYNRLTSGQMEQVRDFIILHYKATERDDSAFWRSVAAMAVPDTLQRKIDLFRECGRIFWHDDDLFSEASWLAVMLGQNIVPRRWDPLADAVPIGDLSAIFDRMGKAMNEAARAMPTHAQFLAATINDGQRQARQPISAGSLQ
ncbi:tryptophan 7-halogenase [Sphingomonas sabuli]|uniref:Tryptophan 7-halogenase n=1 Tax=Sphingomonas sabuli TaxID=2764186 RepID=A0A7G9KZQ9_9SPHN|nr:tryptophan halogenase family protein [Sphingomonas sabuli]QNM81858.1 tryptophan 7-halogenase [Sphingomonas sabuli]